MEIGGAFKIFVLITIASAFIGQLFSELVNKILWAVIFPSLLFSWVLGLMIEEFNIDDLDEDYYWTFELGKFKLSGGISLITIIIFIIKFVIL